ncbi:MAG TPA: efflux RND transporter periplasmic adaptor subunit, partial [Tepidisphaeraceae bacterium]|nr:efflux RND transporter periplasmic adaptor subunit [Tepidisphaeraceae bacterium]
ARVDKWTRPDHAYGQTAPGEDYYCPMHPQVVRTQPGLCPICSMDLKKRTPGERAAAVRDRVQLSPHRVAMAGVATTPVAFKPLVRHVRALGLLDYDETRLANISARVAGRADELFVTYTGQSVKAGEPVYSLYSPEVFTAQREYLQARKRVNDLPADAAPEARADASAVYNASMQKLVLWGIAREQLDKLDKEFDASGKVPTHFPVASPLAGIVVRKDVTPGQYLQVGQSAYTIADLSSLWLRAKVYEADIPLVHIGQKVSVTVDALPNEPLTGTVTFVAFALDPETRTLDARIEVPNKDLRLRPGMFATARISVPAMPAAGASSRPATSPSTPLQSATGNRQSAILQQALQPYLRASDLLANDKLDGVPALLAQSVTTLEPLAADPALKDALARLTAAVNETPGEDIKALRTTFKKVSNALIDVAKITGQPVDAPPVQIFRCPMQDKPYWLQPASATAVNPYMGQRMLDCGGPVENLPRAAPPAPAGTDIASHAAHALAIPRSAVIDTGTRKIVYVQTAPGVFDLRAVTLGPLSSDDLYPVLSGLKENDHVVTAGAFLVDSENRLNPAPLEEADSPQRRGERGGGAVKAGSEKSAPGHVH